MVKYKFKLTIQDLTELDTILNATIGDYCDNGQENYKEIDSLRYYFIVSILKKIRSRIDNGQATNISLSMQQMLTLRYCLMRRRTTPGMGQLFCRIDSGLHPNMFQRKEVQNGL